MHWITYPSVFIACYALKLPLLWSFSAMLLLYFTTGGAKTLRILYFTLWRDVKFLRSMSAIMSTAREMAAKKQGIPSLFYEIADKYPNRTAFINAITGRKYSFKEVDEFSNRVANFFTSEGYKAGDSAALFMESTPEFVMMWLGLTKVGILPALINFNIRREGLVHCVQAANGTALIYSTSLTEFVEEARNLFPAEMKLYCHGETENSSLDTHLTKLNNVSSVRPTHEFKCEQTMLYIYTSGTTGLPKAAKVPHSRFVVQSKGFGTALKITEEDIIYCCLPLYHTAGGVVAIGQALTRGCCVVIRQKFSASNFWLDCCKYRCTVAQYIGELCRYLLAQPVRPEETQHCLRLLVGNGLKPAIWTEFVQRFGIKNIGEFYGATEGNVSALNTENVIGSIGFIPHLMRKRYTGCLVRVDSQNNLIRGSDGFCEICDPGEEGEMIGKIIKPQANAKIYSQFDGYSSKSATEKKIAVNVFTKGDSYFRMGDLLVMDEYGNLFFKDRTGDMFRWKGENVSTAEVEAVISNHINKLDAVVYGVQIPGTEGRAGMVAIETADTQIDLIKLHSDLRQALPSYARPLFVRLLKHVEKTGTFKLKKVELRDQAYDPSLVSDPLYYLNPKSAEYEKITSNVYEEITSSKIRF